MPSLTNSLYEFGEFRLEAQNRVLRMGKEPIALTPKAFEVLLLLIQHSGQTVSKDELMRVVWADSFVEESNLTQTVFMLRKALGETPDQRYILTVPGARVSFCRRCQRDLWERPFSSERPFDRPRNCRSGPFGFAQRRLFGKLRSGPRPPTPDGGVRGYAIAANEVPVRFRSEHCPDRRNHRLLPLVGSAEPAVGATRANDAGSPSFSESDR